MNGVKSLKVMFKVRKFQFGPLIYSLANISETVHAMINVCIKHVYKVVCNLSAYSMVFDLR